MGLSVLVLIMCAAFYVIFYNIKKTKVKKSKEYNVLYEEDTIVDELITLLLEKNEDQENQEKIIKSKEDTLATFIALHRSGSFCSHLSEQEIIYFVQKKLNMEMNKNGQ